MIAAWMLWTLFLGLVVALAARAVEAALEAWRLPRRWVWLAASVATLAGSAAGLRRIAARGGEAGTAGGLPWPAAPATEVTPDGALEGGTAAGIDRALETISGAIADAAALAPPDGVLIGVWAVLAALVAAAWIVGVRRLRLLAANGTTGEVDGRTVRRTEGAGPAVAGVLRPAILWPRWADRLDRERRRAMLLHEEEHVAGRDPAALAAGLAVAALLPWHPALWWQYRRLRRAVEIDCDRRVLTRLERPGEYASLLLDVAERRSLGMPALALVPPENRLEERIDAMISPRPNHPTLRGAALGAAALGLAVVACETPVPVQVHDGTSEEGRAASGVVQFDGDGGEFVVTEKDGGTHVLRLRGDAAATYDREGERIGARETHVRVSGETGAMQGALLVVDGEPMPDISFEDGDETLERLGITHEDIARIEILKGSAAIEAYGDAGAGGVIHITTK